MQPLTFKVASFNVGSAEDWQTLYSRTKWMEKAHKDFSSSADLKAQKEAFTAFEKAEGITKSTIIQSLADKVSNHLGCLMREFDPHILCLQEYVNANTHLPIKQFLESCGYVIVGEATRAIAFKSDAFECLRSRVTFTEKEQEAAFFADLKHRSGVVIRVVSDHLKSFDAVQKKSLSATKAKRLPMPEQFQERLKFLAQYGLTSQGDMALDRSLASLQEDDDPDLIVYGLDAECTSKTSSREKSGRLHPKRMRLFEYYKYQMDHANQNPTCLDPNDWQPRKYDHICVKSLDSKCQISIIDHFFPKVNGPDLLKNPGAIMSDHLPVLSTLTITRLKSDKCAIS